MLKKSNTTWTSDLELNNGPVGDINLEDGSIATTRSIVVKSKVVNLSNFRINCDKLIFEAAVEEINVEGPVSMEAKTIIFKPGVRDIQISGLNNFSNKLSVSYTSAISNGRKLKVEIEGSGQFGLLKK
jgi:hypothetical protein